MEASDKNKLLIKPKPRLKPLELLHSLIKIVTNVQAWGQMQKQKKLKRSEALCWFSQIVGVNLQHATWVSPIAKSPDHALCDHRAFSDTLETLEVEFAWGKGVPRVTQGLTWQQSYF